MMLKYFILCRQLWLLQNHDFNDPILIHRQNVCFNAFYVLKLNLWDWFCCVSLNPHPVSSTSSENGSCSSPCSLNVVFRFQSSPTFKVRTVIFQPPISVQSFSAYVDEKQLDLGRISQFLCSCLIYDSVWVRSFLSTSRCSTNFHFSSCFYREFQRRLGHRHY